MSHSLRIQTIFLLHAVWYEDRALQILKISMSQRSKKGLLQSGLLSARKFYFYVFPDINVVLFICYQRSLIGQTLRENFAPMRNALDQSYTDRTYYISIKMEVVKRIFQGRNFI